MTLTEATKLAKGAKFYVGIPVLAIIVGWLIFGSITPESTLPEKYITPDFMCGGLPGFELNSLSVQTTGTTFSVETTSGAIPDLPKVVNVYKYIHQPSLNALQKAQSVAEDFGFNPEKYTRKSTTEYLWRNTSKAQTLTVETGNLNITFDTDFKKPQVDTNRDRLPTEEQAKTIAKEYLQEHNLLTSDFQKGEQRTYLIQITSNGEFRQSPSLDEADLIRVDFFRQKDLITIDPKLAKLGELGSTVSEQLQKEKSTTVTTDGKSIEVKTFTTDIFNDSPVFGNISVFIGGTPANQNKYEIFKLDYTNWLLDENPCGTYKLISPQDAVKKVQEGNATLVHLLEDRGDVIIPPESKAVKSMRILEVGITYLDRSEQQDFLQPIFYIKGEAQFENETYGTFYYYVPAIDYSAIPEDAGTSTTDDTATEEATE